MIAARQAAPGQRGEYYARRRCRTPSSFPAAGAAAPALARDRASASAHRRQRATAAAIARLRDRATARPRDRDARGGVPRPPRRAASAAGEHRFRVACPLPRVAPDAESIVHGVVIFSRRSAAIAAWLTGVDPAFVKATLESRELLLEVGLDTQYLLARVRAQQLEAHPAGKERTSGLYFLSCRRPGSRRARWVLAAKTPRVPRERDERERARFQACRGREGFRRRARATFWFRVEPSARASAHAHSTPSAVKYPRYCYYRLRDGYAPAT